MIKSIRLFAVVLVMAFSSLGLAKEPRPLFFKLTSNEKGRIWLHDWKWIAGFPNLGSNKAYYVYIYYSDISFEAITPNSPFIAISVGYAAPDDYDNDSPALDNLYLGNLTSGKRYFFKYGLGEWPGHSHDKPFYFLHNEDVNFNTDSIVVK